MHARPAQRLQGLQGRLARSNWPPQGAAKIGNGHHAAQKSCRRKRICTQGKTPSRAITPQPEWLACAENVLQHLPQAPLYARIDGLIAQDGRFMVNEVELIEPALYPQLRAGFTDVLKNKLICAEAW